LQIIVEYGLKLEYDIKPLRVWRQDHWPFGLVSNEQYLYICHFIKKSEFFNC